ncbi:MAG: hypothetical protein J6Z06_08980 [Lachnospiraceae bacterium]|nr:hypothetical protein [Lachnospiraceae bacterium]
MFAELRWKSILAILKKNIIWAIVPLFALWMFLPYVMSGMREVKVFQELSSSEITPGYRVEVTVDYNYGHIIEGQAMPILGVDDPEEDYFAILTSDHQKYILLKTNNAEDRGSFVTMLKTQEVGLKPQPIHITGRIRKAQGLFAQEREAIKWICKNRGIPEDSFLPYVIDCDIDGSKDKVSWIPVIIGFIWLGVIVLIDLWFITGRNLQSLAREVYMSPYSREEIEMDYRNANVVDSGKWFRIGKLAVYCNHVTPHMFLLDEIEWVTVSHFDKKYSGNYKNEYFLMIKVVGQDRFMAPMSSMNNAQKAKRLLIMSNHNIVDGQVPGVQILTRGEKSIIRVD